MRLTSISKEDPGALQKVSLSCKYWGIRWLWLRQFTVKWWLCFISYMILFQYGKICYLSLYICNWQFLLNDTVYRCIIIHFIMSYILCWAKKAALVLVRDAIAVLTAVIHYSIVPGKCNSMRENDIKLVLSYSIFTTFIKPSWYV